VAEVFIHIINDLDYAKHLEGNDEEALKRWDLIYQFYQKAKEFESTQNDSRLVSLLNKFKWKWRRARKEP